VFCFKGRYACSDFPADWIFYYDAAQLFASANDRESAREFIGKAEGLASAEDEKAQLYISDLYIRVGDLDKADSILRRLVDEGISDPVAYRMLAAILRFKGNYSEAIDVLERFLDKHPENIEFQQMIQKLKEETGKALGDSA